MLAFLSGIIRQKLSNPYRCVLEVNGLGFNLFISQNSWQQLIIGQNQLLFTSLQIAPEQVKVYGFTDECEQKLYELISSVKGIGAKSSLALLDTLKPQEIVQAIATGNSTILTQTPGVGKKTAERLIFELKSKLNALQTVSSNGQINQYLETSQILHSLGYETRYIEEAIQSSLDSPNLLQACLQWITKNS